MGMGRDARNVCTELIVAYLNSSYNLNYNFDEIINLIDNVMANLYSKDKWGYSPCYMLNAKTKIHPKYNKYFIENIENISLVELKNILNSVPIDKRYEFDIKTKYISFDSQKSDCNLTNCVDFDVNQLLNKISNTQLKNILTVFNVKNYDINLNRRNALVLTQRFSTYKMLETNECVLLQSAISQNTDDRLKNIVATIQNNQNMIIRAPIDKPLIVQGVAGSGKTTIALHRISYLIYNYDKDFKPENFMIIAPNSFFLDYISNTLPDLGVENEGKLNLY